MIAELFMYIGGWAVLIAIGYGYSCLCLWIAKRRMTKRMRRQFPVMRTGLD